MVAPKSKRKYNYKNKKPNGKNGTGETRRTKEQAIADGDKHTGDPNHTTPFVFGNDLWKLAEYPGRPKAYPDPEGLWQKSCEYFQWVTENPLYEERLFHSTGILTRTKVAKMRAMTIEGLCIFLNISMVSWFEQYCKNPEFLKVTTRVTEIIRKQKFEGAAAEFLNANIIARDLGLADKRELTGNGGGPIETKSTMTLDEATRAYLDGLK